MQRLVATDTIGSGYYHLFPSKPRAAEKPSFWYDFAHYHIQIHRC